MMTTNCSSSVTCNVPIVSSSSSSGVVEDWRTMDKTKLLEKFDQVIDTLEDKVKKYYYIARETVPDIVATETEPSKFLLTTKGDLIAAAKRLAQYWLNRSFLFGDRWLLPMTQVGTGCLSRDDVESLRSGYMTLVTLPNERQMLVIDSSRLDPSVDPGVRERLGYYLATTSLNEKSRREGIDCTVLVNACGFLDTGRFLEKMKVLHDSLPSNMKSMVTIPVPTTEGKEHLIEYFSFLCTRTHQTMSPESHFGTCIPSSTQEALRCLEDRGISRLYLPEKVGGSSLFESCFADWIRMRISLEDTMTLPSRNVLPTIEFSKPDHTQKGLSQIIRRPTGAKLDAKSKEEYVRKRNAMYARRRANKIKIQQVALEDHKETLERENKRLKRENEELELQLARVRVHVSFASPMSTTSTQATFCPGTLGWVKSESQCDSDNWAPLPFASPF